jgi:hypothetical protein
MFSAVVSIRVFLSKNRYPVACGRGSRVLVPGVGYAAGAAQLPDASAHLGQHPRYSSCGDRVEVTL